eukprot:TRINITY_DN18574_c0_g1_i1.p1 TRINITY_DN18574_c0_g1~~TRINITY_DN18574_c0_g1_i1.p1  ORF type:complete len:511 (+),score=121.56 TRINITY_DN18574_c0_g1_i1:97-1629(+)
MLLLSDCLPVTRRRAAAAAAVLGSFLEMTFEACPGVSSARRKAATVLSGPLARRSRLRRSRTVSSSSALLCVVGLLASLASLAGVAVSYAFLGGGFQASSGGSGFVARHGGALPQRSTAAPAEEDGQLSRRSQHRLGLTTSELRLLLQARRSADEGIWRRRRRTAAAAAPPKGPPRSEEQAVPDEDALMKQFQQLLGGDLAAGGGPGAAGAPGGMPGFGGQPGDAASANPMAALLGGMGGPKEPPKTSDSFIVDRIPILGKLRKPIMIGFFAFCFWKGWIGKFGLLMGCLQKSYFDMLAVPVRVLPQSPFFDKPLVVCQFYVDTFFKVLGYLINLARGKAKFPPELPGMGMLQGAAGGASGGAGGAGGLGDFSKLLEQMQEPGGGAAPGAGGGFPWDVPGTSAGLPSTAPTRPQPMQTPLTTPAHSRAPPAPPSMATPVTVRLDALSPNPLPPEAAAPAAPMPPSATSAPPPRSPTVVDAEEVSSPSKSEEATSAGAKPKGATSDMRFLD